MERFSAQYPAYPGEVWDARGAWVLPGLIDAHTHVGMFGDSLGFEGDDGNEATDPSTPHLRALDAINARDRCFGDAVRAGVTIVATGPGSANPIGGQFAIMHTAGVCADGMAIRPHAFMKFALGENPKSVYHGKNQGPETRMATAAVIRDNLSRALRYMEAIRQYEAAPEDYDKPDLDMKLEALLPALRGEMDCHFHAHRADDIFTAVRLAREFGLKLVLVHATEGYLIADELLRAMPGIRVLAGPNLVDRGKPEMTALDERNAAILTAAGALCAVVTDHPVTPIQYLPLCAGLAMRGGLDFAAALRSITLNPARILGIGGRYGSLEPGKAADIAVFPRDPLTDITAVAQAVFVGGELIITN